MIQRTKGKTPSSKCDSALRTWFLALHSASTGFGSFPPWCMLIRCAHGSKLNPRRVRGNRTTEAPNSAIRPVQIGRSVQQPSRTSQFAFCLKMCHLLPRILAPPTCLCPVHCRTRGGSSVRSAIRAAVLHLCPSQDCQVLCYLQRPCLRPRIRLLQQLQVQDMATVVTVRRRQHPGPIFSDTVPTIQALTARLLRGQLLRRMTLQDTVRALFLRHGQPDYGPDTVAITTVPAIQAHTARLLRGQHLRRVLRSIFRYTARALILRHGQPPRRPLFGRAAILGSLMHYFTTNDCNRCMQRPTLWPAAAAPPGSGNTVGWPGLMDCLDWNHAS